ncbi:4'-phosphopantetheinyl transferase superfamily protein [Campylobacter ureolyticus]|nr:4'-phosphopantetheinyl transferase superfamily protein [Campylobacter ureolyticus]MCZ6157392.1 4'-phosphopantetheinyl transferase superfamily protein [Campylobacter ureolyticus]
MNLYFSNKKERISFKNLDKKDKRRVKNFPNLLNNSNFISSRWLKFKVKKRRFCISHKDGFSVLSTCDKKIAIDMEIYEKRDFIKVVDFCFNKNEKKYFYNSSNQKLTFYEIFTTKEAIIKLKNLGFENFKDVSYFDKNITKFHILLNGFFITIVF